MTNLEIFECGCQGGGHAGPCTRTVSLMPVPATLLRISINDTSFAIAPDTNVRALKDAIEGALKRDGAFVEFDTRDGRHVSALIGSPCDVFISIGPEETADDRGPLWSLEGQDEL